MPGSPPPWLQSPRGLLAAGALLVALLLAVPGYLSLTREDAAPSLPAAPEIAEPVTAPASDPLGPAREDWLSTDEVINTYLVHHETGEPIPAELVAKIKKAATFNQGFATTEYLASALMDMRYHMIDPTGLDPDAFERETLAELNMPGEIVMRHRSPHFAHIFSGEGYATGYYGYMWADVLTSDASEAFEEAPGGYYDKALAKKLVEHLFAPRNSVDPAEAYRAFRGRDARIEALMRDRGFPVTSTMEASN